MQVEKYVSKESGKTFSQGSIEHICNKLACTRAETL